MFKTFVAAFAAVVLGGVTLILGYQVYVEMQVKNLVKEVQKQEENEKALALEQAMEFNVKQCIYQSKKEHSNTFELISVDHRSEMLVALTFQAEGFQYHNRCYFTEGSSEMSRLETFSKTKIV